MSFNDEKKYVCNEFLIIVKYSFRFRVMYTADDIFIKQVFECPLVYILQK